jgi:CheY-like chemotaxis protein
MSMEKRRIECVDSLRLSPREQSEIISELSQGSAVPGAAASSKERRHNGRVPYLNEAGLFVQMKHPGGSVVNYLVRTRNLSPTGIAFLHGSFVYTGTACVLALHDAQGKMVGVEGKVVRCQHVRGHVHDIGVRFGKELELNRFVIAPAGDKTTSVTTTAGAEDAGVSGQISEELPKFSGNVLCAEENASDAELLKFYLESLGVAVTVVSSGLEALDYLEGRKFDAVMAAVWLPGMTGPEVAEAARAAGFTKPIIALTADDRYEIKIEALARGCTELLSKPFTAEQLVRVLEAHLPRAAATPNAGPAVEPLPSEMWGNARMRPLITKFVARLAADVREIERLTKAAGAPSADLLGKLCMGLKGTAGGFGYPKISKIAQGLTELVLAEGADTGEQVRAAVVELARLSAAAAAFLDNERASSAAA